MAAAVPLTPVPPRGGVVRPGAVAVLSLVSEGVTIRTASGQ
jgi:hypothetical protein